MSKVLKGVRLFLNGPLQDMSSCNSDILKKKFNVVSFEENKAKIVNKFACSKHYIMPLQFRVKSALCPLHKGLLIQ